MGKLDVPTKVKKGLWLDAKLVDRIQKRADRERRASWSNMVEAMLYEAEDAVAAQGSVKHG